MELVEFESLMSILSSVFLCRDVVDTRIWKPGSFVPFSLKSFYRELDPFGEVWSPHALIWMGLAPPRVDAFCWLQSRAELGSV